MNDMIVSQGTEMAAAAACASAKAEIECAYMMAVRRPRSEADARSTILKACQRPVFAETVEFSIPMGGSRITGPTIRFAEVAMQAWRNLRTSSTVVYDSDTVQKISVTVTDLENNNTISGDATVRKTIERNSVKIGQVVVGERENTDGKKVFIVISTEEEFAKKVGSIRSKLIRNCALKLIPADIIKEAMDAARKARQGNQGDPVQAQRAIIDAFANLGIKASELEQFTGKKIEQFRPDDIENLRGIYTAIKDGEAKWSDYLDDADAKAPPQTLAEKLAAKGTKPPADEPPDAGQNDGAADDRPWEQ
jgi:hypothetical protein